MRTLSRLWLVLGASLVLLAPSLTEAMDTPTPTPTATITPSVTPTVQPTPIPPQAFCDSLEGLSARLNGSVGTSYSALMASLATRVQKFNDNQTAAAQQLTANRAKASLSRQHYFGVLEQRVSTDAEKQAVTAFETAITQAITSQQAAVNAANSTYQQAIATGLSHQQALLTAAATTYRAAVTQALSQASASCGRGVGSTQARTTLKTSITSAQTALQTAVTNAGKNVPNPAALSSTRRTGVDLATNNFMTASNQALAVLKSVLNVTPSVLPQSATSN